MVSLATLSEIQNIEVVWNQRSSYSLMGNSPTISSHAYDKDIGVVGPAAVPDNPNVVLDNCSCGKLGDYNVWQVLFLISGSSELATVKHSLHNVHHIENTHIFSRPIHPFWSMMYEVRKGSEDERLRG